MASGHVTFLLSGHFGRLASIQFVTAWEFPVGCPGVLARGRMGWKQEVTHPAGMIAPEMEQGKEGWGSSQRQAIDVIVGSKMNAWVQAVMRAVCIAIISGHRYYLRVVIPI